jgi:PilZ domain
MAETSKAQPAGSGAALAERRAHVRHPCDRDGSCVPVLAGHNLHWSARVLNISQGGVALSLRRRFEPGTLLTVEIQRADDQPPEPITTRVVRVTAQPDGNWLIGCAFTNPISPEDLQAML